MSDVNKAIEAITRVINASKEKVLLVSGSLAPQAYDSPQMKDAVTKAIERGVSFDVIVGPGYPTGSAFMLDALKNSICVADQWPERHFVVGDSKHIRYETDHKESDGSPVADNMVGLNMPDIAQYLTERFYELKPSCKRLVEIQV